jgi:hypothetical protein
MVQSKKDTGIFSDLKQGEEEARSKNEFYI